MRPRASDTDVATRTTPSAHRRVVSGMVMVLALLTTLIVTCGPAGALGLGSTPDAADLSVAPARAAAIVARAETAARLAPAARAMVRADALRAAARDAQKAHLYTRATVLFERARVLYLEAGARVRARACLTAIQDIYLIACMYSVDRASMLTALAAQYPDVPAAERAAWLDLPSTERLRWDGKMYYFFDLPTNLAYRDMDLFQTQTAMVAGYRTVYQRLATYLPKAAAQPAWEPYGDPKEYDFTQTLSVPRDALAADGDLRVWFPLPIEVGPQDDVSVTEITPTTYLRYPASTKQSIGLLFMSVPLSRLSSDLDVTFRVQYRHAAQYFKVDPDAVGRYDTSGALYQRYTQSRANTKITPSIRRTARRVVGAQTNPYLAAKRLYDYVIDNVVYSHMPHFAMYPRGVAESVYVHQHKNGDCGAQSMYFSALCRAVGIPARCTGGFQTFAGKPSGHFWAEFYLPNYGWIPVDPTAATIADYLPELSVAEKEAFHEFYFGNQDDLRLVVQKDTDLPLIPRANQRIMLPLAIQMPAALCDTMTDIPGMILSDHWTFD